MRPTATSGGPGFPPVESVLVANRGEIARRIIRTCRRMGIRTIAVYSDADADSRHVAEADEAFRIGAAPPQQSYLDQKRLLDVAAEAGARAVHPGYGFLSENAEFADRVIDAGLVWVGPAPDVITSMGDKIAARNLMSSAGVPVADGTAEPVNELSDALAAARRLGFPLMVKSSAGGGGIGMGIAADEASLRECFATAQSRGERFFGSASILLERYIASARHVEVQVLGLADGRVLAFQERDCSVQRRHQKVAEETPSPGVGPELRSSLLAAAVRAAETVGYRGAGTVEFLVDRATDRFYFLEMNTRLQVEHPITELVSGVDLVEQQLLVAMGRDSMTEFEGASVPCNGHAIELRVYAEDPVRFLPSPGAITNWSEPSGDGIRVDAGYQQGDTVTPFYDPLLAKLAVWGPDRRTALERARKAVRAFVVEGPKNNLPFLARVLNDADFVDGAYDTGLAGRVLGSGT